MGKIPRGFFRAFRRRDSERVTLYRESQRCLRDDRATD
jgi:hypothetical protein